MHPRTEHAHERSHLLRLDLAVLHVDLVSHEHDWNVLADANEVTVPVRHILVSNARRDVKHNDRTVRLDVVSVAQASILLLPRSIPHVEDELASVRRKVHRVHLGTDCSDVALLKLSCKMALDKCRFTDTCAIKMGK